MGRSVLLWGDGQAPMLALALALFLEVLLLGGLVLLWGHLVQEVWKAPMLVLALFVSALLLGGLVLLWGDLVREVRKGQAPMLVLAMSVEVLLLGGLVLLP